MKYIKTTTILTSTNVTLLIANASGEENRGNDFSLGCMCCWLLAVETAISEAILGRSAPT